MNDFEKILGQADAAPRNRWLKRGIVGAGIVLLLAALTYAVIQGRKPDAPKYVTDVLRTGDLAISVTATGTLQPTNKVDVGSELSGTIEQVLVDFNQRVKKGQVLAILDTTKLKNQLERTRATLQSARARADQSRSDLDQANANLTRLQKVYELSAGRLPAANELDDARIKVTSAKAALAAAEASVAETAATLRTNETDLTKATIRSPIHGVVLNRNVEPGQTVAASLQAPVLFTLAEDLSQMELKVAVAEADVGSVKEGLGASFAVDAYPDKQYKASVQQVRFGSTTVDNVVSYETILSVDNDDLGLRPGMTATADILVATREDVLLVPNAALRFKPPQAEQTDTKASPLSGLMPRPPGNRQRPQGTGGNRTPRNAASSGASSSASAPAAAGQTRERRGTRAQVWVTTPNSGLRAVPVMAGMSDGRQTEIRSRELKAGDSVVTDVVAPAKR